MGIFKKRFFALLIDSFIQGSFFVVCQAVFLKHFSELGNVADLILLVPFFFKDLAFRNASFGKKLMGIVVFDDRWQVPQRLILVKRTVLMSTVGFCLAWKAKFIDGSIISLFDWESQCLKTQVIERKVLKKIQEEADKQNGDRAVAMTNLYSNYLRMLYVK